MQRACLILVAVAVSVLVGGCPPESYDNLAPATLRAINRIVDDNDLTPQEKRTELEALGLSPMTVNVLLQEERLANQFGGDLRTAYVKVTTPDYRALTPDEIQLYGDEASEVDTTLEVELTDKEAQAIAQFFDDEEISSPEDLEAFLEDSDNEVPEVIPDGVLRSLFVDFDPTRLLSRLP